MASMASKLTNFVTSRKIPMWFSLNSYISNLCAKPVEIPPETHQNAPKINEFDPKIRSLKNILTPETLIRALDSAPDLNSSIEIFRWASLHKRFRHTADTYSWMIFNVGMDGNGEEFDVLCREMASERCPNSEEVFGGLIESFANNCRVREALRVLEIMNLSKFRISIGVCNALLGILVKQKRDFCTFLFAYKEMVKAGIVPNVETLNYLIEVLCENNMVDCALDQFRRMGNKGCSPNSRTFELLICVLCRRSRVNECVMMLDEMCRSSCSPSCEFYSNVIPLLCMFNRPDEGVRLFYMMKDSGFLPSVDIYGFLVHCLCENLKLDDAAKLLAQMVEGSLAPTSESYEDIVTGLCKLGRFVEACNILEENLVSMTSPHNSLIEGYCNAGRFYEANDHLEKMVVRNLADDLSWSILIRGICEKAETRKGLEVLNRMIVSSYIPDGAAYSALIFGLCKESKFGEALDLFHQVRVRYWTLDSTSCSELIEGLCHEKKVHEASDVFRYMSSRGSSIRSSSFNILIKSVCLIGKLDEAISLCSWTYISGISCTVTTYKTILQGFYELGQAKNGLILFSRMLVLGCPIDAEMYHLLINGMHLKNNTNNCAHLLKRMVGDGFVPRLKTLDKLLSTLACNSQLHLVIQSVEKLVCMEGVLAPDMYNIMISGLWKKGYKHEASKLLDLMLEKGWVPNATTHGLLIGSSVGEEGDGISEASKDFVLQDQVGNILVEGLEGT
ncbi:hypothetical protein Scep_014693 [Stephania cephalantha]|uniref:Pentatricopeptide repeat-containing protein n=1 Tax=Stephania cephalantha TaxID=152367 RepID=A0AAP0J1H2_9MAGN